MLYLANPSTQAVRDVMTAGVLGCMMTPAQGNLLPDGATWAADNGCFSEAWKAEKWLTFLDRYRSTPRCLFATVPDVVADAEQTRERWNEWAPVVREMGYPPAYVLQDGETSPPWDELECLFIGGSTAYKLSPEAEGWAREAQRRGKWVHWGRVNSRRRFALAAASGDSCDGTYLAFGPDRNLPRLLAWLNPLDFGVAS